MTGLSSSSRLGPIGPLGVRGSSLEKSSSFKTSSPSSAAACIKSQPAQKAPPSPQKTATDALSSFSNSRKASCSASALSGSIALRASGREWMTVQMLPDFSILTAMSYSLVNAYRVFPAKKTGFSFALQLYSARLLWTWNNRKIKTVQEKILELQRSSVDRSRIKFFGDLDV